MAGHIMPVPGAVDFVSYYVRAVFVHTGCEVGHEWSTSINSVFRQLSDRVVFDRLFSTSPGPVAPAQGISILQS